MVLRVFEIYGMGWMIAFALSLVHFYRKNTAGDMFAKIEGEIEKEPELRKHYDENIHGSRTKMRMFIPLLIIALSFALSSLWPLVLGFRLYGLVRHHGE